VKSIFDRGFQYVPSDKTDLRKVFARVRRRLREEQATRIRPEMRPEMRPESIATAKVSPIKQNKVVAA
jgi:hypothetical protein